MSIGLGFELNKLKLLVYLNIYIKNVCAKQLGYNTSSDGTQITLSSGYNIFTINSTELFDGKFGNNLKNNIKNDKGIFKITDDTTLVTEPNI